MESLDEIDIALQWLMALALPMAVVLVRRGVLSRDAFDAAPRPGPQIVIADLPVALGLWLGLAARVRRSGLAVVVPITHTARRAVRLAAGVEVEAQVPVVLKSHTLN